VLRNTRPGSAPVCFLPSISTSPLTIVCETPSAVSLMRQPPARFHHHYILTTQPQGADTLPIKNQIHIELRTKYTSSPQIFPTINNLDAI
jgi:hypothetical protein